MEITKEDEQTIKEQLGYLPPNLVRVSARSHQINNKKTETRRPIAIQSYPLGGGSPQRRARAAKQLTPFPTLFWLTCPQISKAISNLERRGLAKELEDRCLNDELNSKKWIEQMNACHEEYAKLRWNSLLPDDQQWLLNGNGVLYLPNDSNENRNDNHDKESSPKNPYQGFCDMLQYSGIAGADWNKIKNSILPSVKCLHAHYAHYRSTTAMNQQILKTEQESTIKSTINILGKWTHEILLEEGADFL